MTIEEIKEKKLVYFSASWCGPCKMTKPIVEKVRDERDEDIEIIVLDEIDDTLFNEIKTELKISNVPTTIVFKEGEEVLRHIGGFGEDKLVEMLNS